jgi:hypothetical protein
MDVQGLVVYANNSTPVSGANVGVTGTHIGTGNTISDENGTFIIIMQAPLLVVSNLSLTVTAHDPATNATTRLVLSYEVFEPPPPPPPDPPGPDWERIAFFIFGTIFVLFWTYAAVRYQDQRIRRES